MSVDAATVRAARFRASRLREPDLPDVPSAVALHLAVQGQELRPTLWGLTRRLTTTPATGAKAALAALDGEVLRTHVLRPTWHLVRPEDLRWLLELTGDRVARSMASTEKQWGLGDPSAAIDAAATLVAEGPRTRDQLRAALVERGALAADAPGITLTQILMHAELRQVVVSGPTAGGRHTYVPFDERVPSGFGPLGTTFDRSAAVVELWRRYLPARAYATVKDLALWCGLTLTELRRGLVDLLDAGEVVEVPGTGELDGLRFLATPSAAATAGTAVRGVDLLCAYDELLCSYRESRGVVRDPRARPPGRLGAFIHQLAIDGRVAACWRWPAGVPRDQPLELELQWLRAPSDTERSAVEQATQELAAHLRDA